MKRLLLIIKCINKLGDKAKRQYIKKSNKEFVDCVNECTKNILRGNVLLTSNQTAKLRRNKNLRSLAVKKTSLKKKRQTLKGDMQRFFTELTKK